MSKINSIELEKQLIASIIQYPEVFSDFGHFIQEHDFTSDVLKTIFCVVRKFLSENRTIDKVIVGQDIQNSGISFEDNINVFDFLDALSLIQINKNSIVEIAKELKKYSIARVLDDNARRTQREIRQNLDKPVKELINIVDKTNNEVIDLYYIEDRPIEIFGRISDFILKKGENPVEEFGYKTPYACYNRYFGGIRKNNIYCFASRSGQGKTTFLTDLSRKLQIINEKDNIKILYLDTEMPTEDTMIRIAAAASGVPFWYIDTGNYVKNEELYKKVMKMLKDMKKGRGSFHHKYVANKSVDEIISIVKRWYYNECGRGNEAIIVYDYLKLTGEKVSNDNKEYQVIGEKVNLLKECVTSIQAPLLTAIQINRSGVTTNRKEVTDDESVISISDRVSWFASYLGIFRRKTMEEIAEEGIECGTHKLITLKGRYQGRESQGHQDYIRVEQEGKVSYRPNSIFFNVDNFDVEERGDLRQLIELRTNTLNIDVATGSEELI